jgi:hypothetical protein
MSLDFVATAFSVRKISGRAIDAYLRIKTILSELSFDNQEEDWELI